MSFEFETYPGFVIRGEDFYIERTYGTDEDGIPYVMASARAKEKGSCASYPVPREEVERLTKLGVEFRVVERKR